jgi:Rrf2 family protein
MKLTKKGQYGTRAMVILGLNYGVGPISADEISRQENISRLYLEKLLMKLRSAGLVKSQRGVNGGFELTKKPEDISLFEILTVLDEGVEPVVCILNDDGSCCCKAKLCVTRDVWRTINNSIQQVLKSVTLAEMCKTATAQDRIRCEYS